MIGLGSNAMKMVTWSPQSCWHSSSLTTFSWKICHQISFGHLTSNKLSKKKRSAYKTEHCALTLFCAQSRRTSTHVVVETFVEFCQMMESAVWRRNLALGNSAKQMLPRTSMELKFQKQMLPASPPCPDHGFKVSRFLPNRSKSVCLLFVQDTKCSLVCQSL